MKSRKKEEEERERVGGLTDRRKRDGRSDSDLNRVRRFFFFLSVGGNKIGGERAKGKRGNGSSRLRPTLLERECMYSALDSPCIPSRKWEGFHYLP